jgi:dienelactone hydrolase
MRLASAIALLICAIVRATFAIAAAAPEPVEIPAAGMTLKAVLYRPDGPGPFPVVVGLHGCEGLTDSTGGLSAQYQDWALHLMKAGFAVLYPDSYGSRSLGSQCTVRNRPLQVQNERVADANAARHWLQSQSWAIPGRISLLGWSTGAVSTLWAVRPRKLAKDDGADFRSAVAFYPGCRRLDATAWSARVPTLILAAGADDWSPVSFCEHMVAGAQGRSARASIVVYAGAYQNFDHPGRAVQISNGYAFSSDGSGKVHSGTNQSARADALKRVPQWLAR